ncbi:MAG: HNH endonuclease [Actinomycetota bacterium]|nr:HNH endonuclease [Actinomycetota bacterium]
MAHLHGVISSTHWELLRFVRDFDSRELWHEDGCRDMGQWLAGHFGMSVSQGRRWTDTAHALEKLPALARALQEATLCLDKVCHLARFATPETEVMLIKWAKRTSLNAVRRKAELSERAPEVEDVRAAHEARSVTWWTCDHIGSIYLHALLPAEQGATVTKALTRVAERLAEDPDGATTMEQRCADALFALASQHIAADADAARATVVISTELSALVSGDKLGEVEGYGVIHPETVRRIWCDSRVQMVVRDERGLPLHITPATRTIPGHMRREMLRRDGGCTFPGCGTRAFVDGHHVWPRELGGPHTLGNLTCLCHFHHKLVHEGGWRVQLDRDQRAEWYRPDGTRYEPGQPRPEPEPEPVPLGLTWDELEAWGKGELDELPANTDSRCLESRLGRTGLRPVAPASL